MSPLPQLVWSLPPTYQPTSNGTAIPPLCMPSSLCILRRSSHFDDGGRSITKFWAEPNDPHTTAKEFWFYLLGLVLALLLFSAVVACIKGAPRAVAAVSRVCERRRAAAVVEGDVEK